MAHRRERISWRPVWGQTHQKWSRGFLQNNKWRCDPIFTIDDLMQEAYLTFRYIADSYPRIVDEGQFMAYYKRAMINKMNDRSCRYSRRKGTVEAPALVDVYEVFARRMGETTNAGYLSALLDEMPEDLKLVLAVLADGKLDVKTRRRKLEYRASLSERASEYLKKLGFTREDPIGELKALLT